MPGMYGFSNMVDLAWVTVCWETMRAGPGRARTAYLSQEIGAPTAGGRALSFQPCPEDFISESPLQPLNQVKALIGWRWD